MWDLIVCADFISGLSFMFISLLDMVFGFELYCLFSVVIRFVCF